MGENLSHWGQGEPAPKDIADAMGHTLDTHLQSYARFASTGLAAAYAAANT